MIDLEIRPGAPLGDADFRRIARELFKTLPMARVFEDDYETAIDLLRKVYDAGRARGYYETAPRARC